jgi:hypothetical protein
MWPEQLDYLWDGRRRLAIGRFDADDAPFPQLTVISARDDAFAIAPTLVDVIDPARWRARVAFLDLPLDHRHLRITSVDGTRVTLELAQTTDDASGGVWRLVLLLLPESANEGEVGFANASLSLRGDVERLAREQTMAAGARLVWAIGQRRISLRDEDGALRLRLAPATRVFPAEQSRLAIEALPLDMETAADTRVAPFAIMQHWLAENGAPRAILRLRLADSLEESAGLLGRIAVVLALRQRLRLDIWSQRQKQAGEAAVDPLTFPDIRQAVGDPLEYPDAVGTGDALVVVNLLSLILDPDVGDAAGVAVRRVGGARNSLTGETIEIDFYGAALGDDVGLVCPSAAPGDIAVTPVDPGGAPFARLLRIEGDGLVARRVAEDDPLLDEMLRRASGAARATGAAAARAMSERAAGLRGRRERFVDALNRDLARANVSGRFNASGEWDVLDPLLQTSYAALAVTAPAEPVRLGGFAAYTADPALFGALARGGDLARLAGPLNARGDSRPRVSLTERYLAACGSSGLEPADMSVDSQAHMLPALAYRDDGAALQAARVSAPLEASDWRETVLAARTLADADAIRAAIDDFETGRDADAAAALRDYLAFRQAGDYLPADHAAVLAALVARAGVVREQARARAEFETANPPQEKPKGFFRRLFG